MEYVVKNVKSFIGNEGYGYTATLYRDGKRVASVHDDANGGMVDFHWEKGCGGEALILEEYCKTLPPVTNAELGMPEDDSDPMDRDPDIFMAGLVGDYEERQVFKRDMKKRVVLIVDGKLNYSKAAPGEPTIKALEAKYPDAIILNRLPPDHAWRVYKDHLESQLADEAAATTKPPRP